MIPASRFSPAAVKLLSYSPLPDAEGFVRYTISQPENGVQGIGKLDYVHSDKHTFVFRAFESDSNQPFHSPPDNIHAARYGGYQDGRSATLGHTFIMNPNTVVHTQVTGAHQLANIATDFPLTTADLGVNLNAYGEPHRHHDDPKRRIVQPAPASDPFRPRQHRSCCTTGTSPRATTAWCGV